MRSFLSVLSNDVILRVAASGDLKSIIFLYVCFKIGKVIIKSFKKRLKLVRLLNSHFV